MILSKNRAANLRLLSCSHLLFSYSTSTLFIAIANHLHSCSPKFKPFSNSSFHNSAEASQICSPAIARAIGIPYHPPSHLLRFRLSQAIPCTTHTAFASCNCTCIDMLIIFISYLIIQLCKRYLDRYTSMLLSISSLRYSKYPIYIIYEFMNDLCYLYLDEIYPQTVHKHMTCNCPPFHRQPLHLTQAPACSQTALTI